MNTPIVLTEKQEHSVHRFGKWSGMLNYIASIDLLLQMKHCCVMDVIAPGTLLDLPDLTWNLQKIIGPLQTSHSFLISGSQ